MLRLSLPIDDPHTEDVSQFTIRIDPPAAAREAPGLSRQTEAGGANSSRSERVPLIRPINSYGSPDGTAMEDEGTTKVEPHRRLFSGSRSYLAAS